jgi:hypothetical protein
MYNPPACAKAKSSPNAPPLPPFAVVYIYISLLHRGASPEAAAQLRAANVLYCLIILDYSCPRLRVIAGHDKVQGVDESDHVKVNQE